MDKELTVSYRVKEKISLREKTAYSMGAFASNIVWSGVTAFSTYYYTESVGIAAAAIGTMFVLSRVLDGISDLIMGLILDRTKSRFGKARPWLLWMAIPFAIATMLLFAVPHSLGPLGRLVYAYITYNLLSTVVYTAINQGYCLLSVLITDNPKDRTSLNVFRMIGATLCAILVNAIVMPMVNGFGGGPGAWTTTFLILSIIAAFMFFGAFAGTKERLTDTEKKREIVPVKTALLALVKNKHWWNRTLSNLIITIISATAAVNVFYAAYWLGNDTLGGFITIINLLPMMLSLVFSTSLVEKFGKRNVCLIFSFIGLGGFVVQIIDPGSMALTLAGQALRGLSLGPVSAVGFVMLADTIDYGEWKTGVRTEGLVFSSSSFGSKVGTGIGSALVGWVLAWGGYIASAKVQADSVLNAILAVYIYIPAVLQVVSIILLFGYTLDKHLPKILRDLNNGAL
ncbi:glycoside-pentoside-hexuronide (GPH):cation symporter [Diplocloster hominis]|uniref:MFS transporter n=1 Tax=Diplocloster hominis TaxID=3079010 RepID=UPI0031BB10AD